ncbi:unnamed protein product, partial [Ixodes pacificus]
NKTRRRTSLIGSAVAAHCVSRRLLRRACGRPATAPAPKTRSSPAAVGREPFQWTPVTGAAPPQRVPSRLRTRPNRSEIAVGGASYGPAAERFRRRLRRGRNCPDRATPRLLRIMRRKHALETSGHS